MPLSTAQPQSSQMRVRCALLGHIVSWEAIAVDPGKIKAIIEAPTLGNEKALSHFLGQIRLHSRMPC